MEQIRVVTMDNGTFRLWNVSKGKWVNRKRYPDKAKANKAARKIQERSIK